MDSAMISKIQKARRYAEDPTRIIFNEFAVTIQGDNHPHTLSYRQGEWSCDCDYFNHRGYCSHTMAMERVLGVMLPQQSAEASVI